MNERKALGIFVQRDSEKTVPNVGNPWDVQTPPAYEGRGHEGSDGLTTKHVDESVVDELVSRCHAGERADERGTRTMDVVA